MAKKVNEKKIEKAEKVVDDIKIEDIDLDIDNTEKGEEDEVDELEEELVETTAPKKAKKAKKAEKSEGVVKVADLAQKLNTTPRELRMFLRKNFRDMSTEKGHTYVWDEGSKEVQEIIDAYQASKAKPKAIEKAKNKEDEGVENTVETEGEDVAEDTSLDDLDLEEID